MKATEKHYVRFVSPGTLFPEETRKPIDSWDAMVAAKMATNVKERHGATPYGFKFETYLECEPIKVDGVSEPMKVEPKFKKSSGFYFLGGILRTAQQVLDGTDPKEDILRSNVRCNHIKAVVTNTNSYTTTCEFYEDSVLLDRDGTVRTKGEDLWNIHGWESTNQTA